MPDQDVVELLVARPARIEELFATVIATSGAVQQDAFHELVQLLAEHGTTEEETVHPLDPRTIDAGDKVVVDARLAEERAAKELLADLHAVGPGDPRFDAGIVALRDAVRAHATYEERYELRC